jgi:hypothetical protein
VGTSVVAPPEVVARPAPPPISPDEPLPAGSTAAFASPRSPARPALPFEVFALELPMTPVPHNTPSSPPTTSRPARLAASARGIPKTFCAAAGGCGTAGTCGACGNDGTCGMDGMAGTPTAAPAAGIERPTGAMPTAVALRSGASACVSAMKSWSVLVPPRPTRSPGRRRRAAPSRSPLTVVPLLLPRSLTQ